MIAPKTRARPAPPKAARGLGCALLFTLCLWSLHGWPAAAQGLVLEPITSDLTAPVALTHSGDDRLFVAEQAGRIVILRGGAMLAAPFLDIRSRVLSGGERGLLSVAFHPDYPSNGSFFVNYTRQTDGATVIARLSVSGNPDLADPDSERILLVVPQPFSNHNGGQIQFGPDGMLYVGMGDGGSGFDPQCHAQRADSLLGKLLRLDVDQNVDQPPYYGIPAANPFAGPGDPPGEVWALGLRNPWRFSFDRQTGDLLLADVGQSLREEIDFEPAADPRRAAPGAFGGRNYGWKVLEGTLCTGNAGGCAGGLAPCGDPGYVAPVLEYAHTGGNCSVTGGYVYRGSRIAELLGQYLYGDLCSGRIWAAASNGGVWESRALPFSAPQLSSFGEDRDGELYVVQLTGLVSLIAGPSLPTPGTIELTSDVATVSESAGQVTLVASRSGGSDGAVTAQVAAVEETASLGLDFLAPAPELRWDDGEMGNREIVVPLVDDAIGEADETLRVELASPGGGATLGTRRSATVTILDDDRSTRACLPSATTLCLGGGRFEVSVAWESPAGASGAGQAVALTTDSGYFWFFTANNVELLVKVLDACQDFDRFWFFGAGLTDVGITITVRDSHSGLVARYMNPKGIAIQPILDTAAFATCP